MKKKIFSISASLLLLTMLTIPAGAANVDVTDPDAMLPVDIILDQDNREIRKVYDLSPNTDPSTLPMQQFERDGLLYELSIHLIQKSIRMPILLSAGHLAPVRPLPCR